MEEQPIDVTVQDARRRLDAGEILMVDVREPEEWYYSHVPGDDVWHVPLNELLDTAKSIPDDRPIVFICRVGGRSTLAAEAFRAGGREAYSLEGGMLAWYASDFPLTPEGADIAEH